MKQTTVIDPKNVAAPEGLRSRKRRQTRERIVNTALQLFLDRGFDSITVDEIAAAADVSKRSFFDYFPSKEDVVFAWQDVFGEALAAAVAARPANEPLIQTVEEALTSSITAAAHPAALAVDDLIRKTPALRERDYLKYAKLEQTLAGAFLKRLHGDKARFRSRLLASVVVAGLRLGGEEWHKNEKNDPSKARAFTKRMFRQVWMELHSLSSAFVEHQKAPASRARRTR